MSVWPIVRVAEDERVVVFRMGRTDHRKVYGPGLIVVAPIIDRPVRVDMRRREVVVDITIRMADRSLRTGVVTTAFRVVDPYRAVTSVIDLDDDVRARVTRAIEQHHGDPQSDGWTDAVGVSTSVRAFLEAGAEPTGIEILDVSVTLG